MDKVTITLQNKELIEQILASSKDIEIRAHNAIIDTLTKRLIKNVQNSYSYDKSVEKAMTEAENDIRKKLLNEKATDYGYGRVYSLKPEYEKAVKNAVNGIWVDKIDDSIKGVIDKIVPTFESRLKEALEKKLREIETTDFEKVVEKAVRKIMQEKFK